MNKNKKTVTSEDFDMGYFLTDEEHETLKKSEKKFDVERHHRMIGAILRICELAGYKVESRIVLRDIKTGKIWK